MNVAGPVQWWRKRRASSGGVRGRGEEEWLDGVDGNMGLGGEA